MSKTIAVNIYKDKFDVYCGRGKGLKNNPLNCKVGEYGWLGNPISLNKKCIVCKKIHIESGSSLKCYEKYLIYRLKDRLFLKEFLNLNNKALGCFCKPKPCHVDVIIKYLDKLLSTK